MNPLYPIFKSGSKQKLSKDFDQFDRDHAPLYQMNRYVREYAIARHEVETALAKAGPMDAPEWDYTNAELIQELERRKKMITEADRLRKDVHFALDKMEQYSTKVDKEATRLRREIAGHVASVFPGVKEKLDRIDAVIQSELNRLSAANAELIVENTQLKTQAATSKETGEFGGLIDKLRERLTNGDQQDEIELTRLRSVEAEFQVAKQSLEEQKANFERIETKLDWEVRTMREERNKFSQDLQAREEELEEAIRSKGEAIQLKEEAEANFEKLEQEKERVDEQLEDERERVEQEKSRASSLDAALQLSRQESEARRQEIEELRRQLAIPRSLDAGGREHMELFSLRQEAANWSTWRSNRMAEVETLKAEKEVLRTESANRQTTIETMKQDAQFAEEMEKQLNQQVSEIMAENARLEARVADLTQLKSNFSELESDIASKNTEISKLERKYTSLDNNFEWVKGRFLEYFGMYQVSTRENQQLRASNEELGKLVQRIDDLEAERDAADKLIDQLLIETTKGLEALKSRRASTASQMSWHPAATPDRSRTPALPTDPSDILEPSIRRADESENDPGQPRTFNPVASNRYPYGHQRGASSLGTSAAPSNPDQLSEQSRLTSARREQTTGFSGIGASVGRRVSNGSLSTSEYVSPYGRDASPTPGGMSGQGMSPLSPTFRGFDP